MTETIAVEHVDGIAVVRIDRPPLNVLDTRTQDALADAASDIAGSDAAAVVLWGGERTFAAGADVKEMHAMSSADLAARPQGLQRGFTELAALQQPVIAAITGFALGGGCELALTADVRFAADDAVLGQPEVTLGMIPGCGGTQRLARLVGASRAKELMLTGRRIGAEEALQIGLIDRVLGPAEVLEASMAWARQFVGGPARAYAAVCQAVDEGLALPLDDALALERTLFADVFATQDKDIGTGHFVDKAKGRAPFVAH